MKLKNKRTGEIIETVIVDHGAEWELRNEYTNEDTQTYNSLAELNEEWEDYEEPKEYWRIDCDGEIEDDGYEGTSFDKDCKAIGNYFETKEEAEKAVEKLKAWKRLRDKEFEFVGHPLSYDEAEEAEKDLDLLFGGEE